MTLDTSALVAILFSEANHLDLVEAILEADFARVGAPTVVETALVFAGRTGRPAAAEVEGLISELGVAIVPFGDAEWRRAIDAFAKYGRSRHKAALNFGDCLAYATAAVAGDSLLYVGGDFRHTDVRSALS